MQACWKSSGNMPSNMPVLNAILLGNKAAAEKVLIRLQQPWWEERLAVRLNAPNKSGSLISDEGILKLSPEGEKGLGHLLTLWHLYTHPATVGTGVANISFWWHTYVECHRGIRTDVRKEAGTMCMVGWSRKEEKDSP